MKERRGNTFWYVWAIFCTGLVIGGVCITQHGDAARVWIPPANMTPDEINELEHHITEAMEDAGWSHEKIDSVLRKFDCDYRQERCHE